MEEFDEKKFNISTLMKIYFKAEYSNMFSGIKNVSPVKRKILMSLLDGKWHPENEIIKMIKDNFQYLGSVTLQTMIQSLNNNLDNNYLEKKIENDKIHYKLSDNYIGLTRAAFTKFRFIDL